tara:strand:+ start:552 stop:1235 length:684 start_codon:yes stop_codon:yes gene_type:complete
MQTPLPEHDLVQPMEDGDEPLGADESGEDGLLMRMDVPSLHAGAKRFVFMCKGVTERVLDHCNAKCRAPDKRYLYPESNAEYEDVNILSPRTDDGMAFLKRDWCDWCGVLLRADDSEVFFDDLEAIEELIEEGHWLIEAVQSAYYAPWDKLHLNPETPNEVCVLVTVPTGEMWPVPTYCLRFVAMLKHWRAIRAWAWRARERANAPGGAAARRAASEFAACVEAMGV